MSKSQQWTPDETWIFGVCNSISKRAQWDLTVVRGAAAVLLLLIPVLTGIVYVVAAYLLDETRAATQSKVGRWARQADEWLEAILQRFRAWQAEPASSAGTIGESHGHK